MNKFILFYSVTFSFGDSCLTWAKDITELEKKLLNLVYDLELSDLSVDSIKYLITQVQEWLKDKTIDDIDYLNWSFVAELEEKSVVTVYPSMIDFTEFNEAP